MFVATFDKTLKSYVFANIVGAEIYFTMVTNWNS